MTRIADIRIGELARRSGCNIETIRYYERAGLLPQPARSPAGYRLYGAAAVGRLAFVRRARRLGFGLDEIRSLLALSASNDPAACCKVRDLAARHLADVRARLAELQAMEAVLAEAVRRCDAGEAPHCPVIESLSRSDQPAPDPAQAGDRPASSSRVNS